MEAGRPPGLSASPVVPPTSDGASTYAYQQLALPAFSALLEENAIPLHAPLRPVPSHRPTAPRLSPRPTQHRSTVIRYANNFVPIEPEDRSEPPSSPPQPPNPRGDIRTNTIGPTEVISLITPTPSPEPEPDIKTVLTSKDDALEIKRPNLGGKSVFTKRLDGCRPVPVVWPPRLSGVRRRSRSASPRSREPAVARAGSILNPIVIPEDEPVVQLPLLRRTVRPEVVAEVLVLYSDGCTLMNGSSGCGVSFLRDGRWDGISIALGKPRRGSYAAEAAGLIEAFQLATNLLRPGQWAVEVYTDHRGLIQNLQDADKYPQTRFDEVTRPVLEARAALRGMGVAVATGWVKGHKGIGGNEMADILARKGADMGDLGWIGELEVNGKTMGDMSSRAHLREANKAQNVARRLRKLARRRG